MTAATLCEEGVVVGAQMDIEVDQSPPLTEAEVVYLADKIVKGRYIISVKDRFATTLEKYEGDPEAYNAVLKQLKKVKLIIAKMENITGHPVESIPVLDFSLNSMLHRKMN